MKNSYKIALLALALTSNLAPLLAAPAIKLLLLIFQTPVRFLFN